jgi:hypothetical protein
MAKFNAFLTAICLCGLIALSVTAWSTIQRFNEQLRSVSKWVATIDKMVAATEKTQSRHERSILDLLQRQKAPGSNLDGSGRKPKVTMFGDESCGPCNQWWSSEAPKWSDQGWEVEKRPYELKRPIPYFRVFDGTREFWVWDPLTIDSYNKARGSQ